MTATLDLTTVPVSDLVVNNYRDETDRDRAQRMADSWNPALLDPIRVAPMADGRFEIVSGHHRALAAQLAGVDSLPAVILDCAPSSADALVEGLAGNLSAQASKPTEDANALGRLIAAGMTVEEIATRIGRPVSFVERRLAILELDPAVRFIVDRHGFSWADPLRGLPGGVQTSLVRLLEEKELNRAQWSKVVADYRAEADKLAQESMFGDLVLTVEEWSTDLDRYLTPETETVTVGSMPDYLDIREVAEFAKLKLDTIYMYRYRKTIPPPDRHFGKTPVWERSTIVRWLETRNQPGRPKADVRP